MEEKIEELHTNYLILVSRFGDRWLANSLIPYIIIYLDMLMLQSELENFHNNVDWNVLTPEKSKKLINLKTDIDWLKKRETYTFIAISLIAVLIVSYQK